MGKVKVTPELRGSLGECYYKEYCAQRGWAYTSLEQVYKNGFKEGRLDFKFGFQRIQVRIPEGLRPEIIMLATPSNIDELAPSFVFDFLAVKAWDSIDPRVIDDAKAEDFRWVEVKTGGGELSPNQLEKSKVVNIPLVICRIPNVTSTSHRVQVYWNSVQDDLARMSEYRNDGQG
jgi:hypothetical protein